MFRALGALLFFLLLPTACGVGFIFRSCGAETTVAGGFLKLWGETAAGGEVTLVVVIVAGGGTVASRPGRTRASVPTLALGFACAGRAKAPVPTRSVLAAAWASRASTRAGLGLFSWN
jgi:hypothetical protein